MAQRIEKEPDSITKVGDSTIRDEMTMPKSPIMGESTERKSPPQLQRESLVSTMARDIKLEKDREKEDSPIIERTIVQPEI